MRRSPLRTFVGVVILIAAGIGLASLVTESRSRNRIQVGAVEDSATPGFRFVDAVPPDLERQLLGDVQAWTGEELITFGSDLTSGEERSGGVAYNPASGAWRQLPRSAFSAPIANPTGVWTGDRLVVLGALCSDNAAEPEAEAPSCSPGNLAAATYDSKDDEWESIDAPPSDESEYSPGTEGGSQRAAGAVDGNAFVSVSGRLWTLPTGSNEWQPAPSAPDHTVEFCSGQTSLIALQSDPTLVGPWSASALRPGADAWIQAPRVSLGDGPFSSGKIICSPSGALLTSVDLQRNLFFDVAGNTWTEAPSAPLDLIQRPPPPDAEFTDVPPLRTYVMGAWTGKAFVFWQSGVPEDEQNALWPGIAVAVDVSTGQWRSAAPGPPNDEQLQWVDGYALVLGAQGEQPGVAIYVPGA